MSSASMHPDKIGSLTEPERAVWGLIWFTAYGGWQQYGVMPPDGMTGRPSPDLISLPFIAAMLGITEPHAEALWLGLVQKGAVSVD